MFVSKVQFCTDRKFIPGPADEECLTSVSSSSRRVASSRSKRIRSFTKKGRGGRGRAQRGEDTVTRPHGNAMRIETKGEDEESGVREERNNSAEGGMEMG